MKAVIISNFDTYSERIDLLKEYYDSKGYETTVIMSNFRHFKKEFINQKKEGYLYIKTKPYYKNLSFQRLYSHYKFAKDAFKAVEKINPDLLHVLIPSNSLARYADKYKEKNNNVTLYFDLIDLWPETMPVGSIKNYFPFTIWKNIRDNHLDAANCVLCECDLYRKVLKKENDDKYKVLYWAKKDTEIINQSQDLNLPYNEINLCYLGSINNIIDIDYIIKVCKELNIIKKTNIHIIGNGESKEELLNKLVSNNISYIDHGTVYDKQQKQIIFNQCHFGLNIMKSNVCVGLTMKSLDYFQGGLPIINTIKGDTYNFVDLNKIGYNDLEELLNDINNIDYNDMRNKVYEFYLNYFSKQKFFDTLNTVVRE